MSEPPAAEARGQLFPQTRWTLVLAARRDPARRREALEALIAPRWKALFVLARKHGLEPAAAEDAVQGFAVRLLDGDLLERLDPAQGRLRAYLKTAFRNHLTNLHEHAQAAKRGGGERALDLSDVEALLAAPAPSPEALFDRAWAAALVDDALAALEQEFAAGDRRGPFEILRELFSVGATSTPYPALAARHGMTVPQLKSFVHRAKARFRALVRARVADTVAASDDVDDELRVVLEALAA